MALEDTLQQQAGPVSLLPPSPLLQAAQTPEQQGPEQGPESDEQSAGQSALGQPGGATLSDVMPAQLKQFGQQAQQDTDRANQAKTKATQSRAAYMRSLGQHALAAAGTLVSHLGDAAAVGTVPPGGGALEGIYRTMGARQERTRQMSIDEQNRLKNEALVAETNVRRMHEQRLNHQLGEQSIQRTVDEGNKQAALLRSMPIPALEKQKGLTSEQIPQLLKNKSINLGGDVALPTGTKVIGEDADTHEPISVATYSIFSVPPSVKLDPSNPDQKNEIDILNRYSQFPKQTNEDGTVTMTGPQYIAFRQQANDAMTVRDAFNKAAIASNTYEEQKVLSDEGKKFMTDPTLLKAITLAGNDQSGNKNLLAVRDIMSKTSGNAYPHIETDMEHAFPGEWAKYRDAIEKQQAAAADSINQLLKREEDAKNYNEAQGVAEELTDKLTDPRIQLPPGVGRDKIESALNRAVRKAHTFRQHEIEVTEEKKEPLGGEQVYAHNKVTGRDEQISYDEYKQGKDSKYDSYSGGKGTQAQMKQDASAVRQLADVQLSVSRMKQASDLYQNAGGEATWNADQTLMAKLISEDKLKAHFLGAEFPVDWVNELHKTDNWRKLSDPGKNLVDAYLKMRAAIPIYNRAATGSGRGSDKLIQLESGNVPSPSMRWDDRDLQLKSFQENLDLYAKDFPRMRDVPIDAEDIKNQFSLFGGYRDNITRKQIEDEQARRSQTQQRKVNVQQQQQQNQSVQRIAPPPASFTKDWPVNVVKKVTIPGQPVTYWRIPKAGAPAEQVADATGKPIQ